MMANVLETRVGKLALGPDGIVHMTYLPKVDVALEDAREAFAAFIEACAGQRRPALIDSTALKSITREAREYYASDEVATWATAIALLVGTPVSKVLGNCFLGIKTRKIPTRLFTSDDAARNWLRQFMA